MFKPKKDLSKTSTAIDNTVITSQKKETSRQANNISKTINVSGHGNNCGLYALALGAVLASREMDPESLPDCLTDWDITPKTVSSHGDSDFLNLFGEHLRSELTDALQGDPEYRLSRQESFVQSCLDLALGDVPAKDMEAFVEGNVDFITRLTESFNNCFSDMKEIQEFVMLEPASELVEELNQQVREFFTLPNPRGSIAALLDMHTPREILDLANTCRQFHLLWQDVSETDASIEIRKVIKEEAAQWFLQRANQLISDRIKVGIVDWKEILPILGRCYQWMIGGESILDNAKTLFIQSRVSSDWEGIFTRYLDYIRVNSVMLSADELGVLACKWNVGLTVRFPDRAPYQSFSKDQVFTLQITLANPTRDHWQVERREMLSEIVPAAIEEKQEGEFSSEEDRIVRDRKQDLESLAILCCKLESLLACEKVSIGTKELLREIGKYCLKPYLSFNDDKVHGITYIRNCYGTIDRSRNGKKNPAGIPFIHLAALFYLFEEREEREVKLSDEILELFKPELEVILQKCQLILKEEEDFSKIDKVLKAFEDLPKFEEGRFYPFIRFYYSKKVFEAIQQELNGALFETIDFRSRHDRYYLGRILSIVGEYTKGLIDFSPDSDRGLIGFFTQIRNKKFAHTFLVLSLDPSKEQIEHFELFRELLLTKLGELVRLNLETMTALVQRGTGDEELKDFKIEMGNITKLQRLHLNRIMNLIFGGKSAEIDRTILQNIGTESEGARIENMRSKKVKAFKKAKEIEIKDPHATLDIMKRKIKLISTFRVKEKTTTRDKKKLEEVISEFTPYLAAYNKAVANYPDLQIRPAGEFPTEEEIESVIAQSKESNIAFIKSLKEEDELELGSAEVGTEGVDSESEEGSDKKETSKTPSKEDYRKKLKRISKELNYLMEVTRDEGLSEKKKLYIQEFALTKIGQAFKDLPKPGRDRLLSLAPKEFHTSVTKTTSTRHGLMHDLFARHQLPFHQVLFRQTLPASLELEALNEVIEISDGDQNRNVGILLRLANANTQLKRYDEALSIYEEIFQMLDVQLILIESEKANQPMQSHLIDLVNTQVLMARTYSAMAEDLMALGQNEEAEKFYEKKIECLRFVLALLEPPSSLIPKECSLSAIASNYNNIGNTQSDMGRYKEAVESHKIALKYLSMQEFDKSRWALFLYNLAHTSFDNIFQSILRKPDLEKINNIKLITACLWEVKAIYDEELRPHDDKYIRLMTLLVKASLFSGEWIDYKFAETLYRELKELVANFPAREGSQEIQAIKEVRIPLGEIGKILREKLAIQLSQEETTPSKKEELERKMITAYHLMSFYVDAKIILDLSDRVFELRTTWEQQFGELPDNLRVLTGVGLENTLGSIELRRREPAKALKHYLNVWKMLQKDPEDKQLFDMGIFEENMGDTYLALGRGALALDYFKKAMVSQVKNQPIERTFKLPLKIPEALALDKDISRHNMVELAKSELLKALRVFADAELYADPRLFSTKELLLAVLICEVFPEISGEQFTNLLKIVPYEKLDKARQDHTVKCIKLKDTGIEQAKALIINFQKFGFKSWHQLFKGNVFIFIDFSAPFQLVDSTEEAAKAQAGSSDQVASSPISSKANVQAVIPLSGFKKGFFNQTKQLNDEKLQSTHFRVSGDSDSSDDIGSQMRKK